MSRGTSRGGTAVRGTVTLLVTLLAVAACGTGDGPGGNPTDDPPPGITWTSSDRPLDTDGFVWAVGTTVHLADGATVTLPREPAQYAVAGDAVYLTGHLGGPPPEDADPWVLQRVDADGTVTDLPVRTDAIGASADGRHLVYLDLSSGPTDRYGTPRAEVVVVDTREGREVLRSGAGLGDPASDDLAAAYPDAEVRLLAVEGDRAFVATLEGTYLFDAAAGIGEPWEGPVPYDAATDPLVSPGGDWRVVGGELVGPGGETVRPFADPAPTE
ncbi:MAG TPA: hypothetical protein VGE77_08735, partial [Nocardioides sp.]